VTVSFPAPSLWRTALTITAGLALFPAALLLRADPSPARPPVAIMDTTDHAGNWVGKTARPFAPTDSDGKAVDLSRVIGTRPVVLIFYRGAWCPFCRSQFADLARHRADLERAGAAVYAISNEAAPKLNQMRDTLRVGFVTFLSDPDGKAAVLYAGLYPNSPVHQPGSFVIDKRGKIVYAYVNQDYKSRAATTSMVRAAERSR